MSGTNGNGSEKLAAEQERLRERRKRESEKLYRLVGEACCKAAGDADFAPVLHQVLDRVTDTKARRFLTEKGMI